MTISVEYMEVRLWSPADNPSEGKIGIEISFYLYSPNPSEEGKIRIQWGNVETEIFTVADWAVALGHNKIGNSMPPGTHRICIDVV